MDVIVERPAALDVHKAQQLRSLGFSLQSKGLSQSHFREHVWQHVRSVKVGRIRIVAVMKQLERWLYLHGPLR